MSLPALRRPDAGFSLMEVVVALAVATLIMLGALTVLDTARHTTRRTMSVASAQQSGTYAMQELRANLKRAGLMVGKRNAFIAGTVFNGNNHVAMWDNYSAATYPYGVWSLVPAGSRVFTPVPGTDGIVVRYNNDTPPIHVCAMPGANASRLELAWDPSMAGDYPADGAYVELLSSSPCPGYGAAGEDPYMITIQINQSGVGGGGGGNCSCTGQNCNLQASQSCVAMDPLCRNIYTNRFNACYQVTFHNNIGCDFCQVGPTYMMSARSMLYWISTEDGTGNIANSRPVLVTKDGLGDNTAARIVSTDIEDLQVAYLIDHNDTAGAGLAPSADGTPATLDFPSGRFPAIRALRVNLTARTPVTDLQARNQGYCATRPPAFRELFTRPTLENHPKPTSGPGFCDGYRRTTLSETMNLANMRANPL